MLQAVRKSLNKLENELVTIEEFCQYAGLKIEQVEPLIFGWKGETKKGEWIPLKYPTSLITSSFFSMN